MRVDVAVIGASSAGMLTAYLLARRGIEVTLFEQQPRFRPRPRTLIVTSAFQEVYPFPAHAVILHQSPWMTVTVGRVSRTLVFQKPDLVIERARLLHSLLHQVQETGIRIWLGHRLSGIRQNSQGVSLEFQRPRSPIQTVHVRRAVIAGDGVFSDARRLLGLPPVPAIPIVQARVPLPQTWDPRRTQVWFSPHHTRYFFWLIPENSTTGVLGVMTDAHGRPASALQEFAQRLGLPLGEYQASWVALYRPGLRPHVRTGRVRWFFVGDAAGQVKNTTVGGTVTGLWAAHAVARTLLNATPFWWEARDLYAELLFHWFIRRALHHFTEAHYHRLIHDLPPKMAQLLIQHPRDHLASVFFWGLIHAPRLWTLFPAALASLLQPFPPSGPS